MNINMNGAATSTGEFNKIRYRAATVTRILQLRKRRHAMGLGTIFMLFPYRTSPGIIFWCFKEIANQ